MNKNVITLLTLLSLTLTGCNASNGSSSNSNSDNNNTQENDTNSSENNSQDSSTSELTTDESIKLTSFGDLYKNSFRIIYATLEKGHDYDVSWKSSNPKVLDIMLREESDKECFVYQTGFGTATVTAYLTDYPGVKASKTYTIKQGEVMPKDLFSKVTGAMKVSTEDYSYSYDKNFVETEDEHYHLETIYEEMGAHYGDLFESTDAYEFTSTNTKNNKVKDHFKYVRNEKDYIGEEMIDLNNQLVKNNVLNGEGNPVFWENSIYTNLFGKEALISNNDFVSVDGGKTYHYTGLSENATDVLSSMYLLEVSADDLYFSVNGSSLTLTAELEPFSFDVNALYRSGRKFVSTFSDFGSARISHLTPNPHKEYHDSIANAFGALKFNKNYTVNTTLSYKDGSNAEEAYKFQITPSDIYYEYKLHGVDKGKFGVHKDSGDAYFDYRAEQEIGVGWKLIITKQYKSGWNSYANQTYPKFSYAAELFEPVEGKANTYQTIDNHGAIILRSFILGPQYSFYEYPGKAIISLDDFGNLKTFETDIKNGQQEYVFKATFSNIGNTKINFNFDNAQLEETPKTWYEANKALYKDMELWNIQDAVPYLAAANGYKGYVGKQLDDGDRLLFATISTENFDDETTRDQFISDYKALLVSQGYENTNTQEAFTGYDLYKKGSYYIGVGIRMNRTHNSANPTNGAMIIIQSNILVEPEY